jgi:polyisoprenoid-binding protein YceI
MPLVGIPFENARGIVRKHKSVLELGRPVAIGLVRSQSRAVPIEHFIIQPANSRFDVHTGTKGVLSRLAHDHIIRAIDLEGTIALDPNNHENSKVSISLPTKDLQLIDSQLSSSDRSEIVKNMRSSLDVSRFPSILFASTKVSEKTGGVEVLGELRIKGRAKGMSVFVRLERQEGLLIASGRFSALHSDFGIKPYSAAFGTIRVADELRFEFLARCKLRAEETS